MLKSSDQSVSGLAELLWSGGQVGEALAELAAACILPPTVIVAVLHMAASHSPCHHLQHRCFLCLSAYISRANLLELEVLDSSFVDAVYGLLQRLLPQVRISRHALVLRLRMYWTFALVLRLSNIGPASDLAARQNADILRHLHVGCNVLDICSLRLDGSAKKMLKSGNTAFETAACLSRICMRSVFSYSHTKPPKTKSRVQARSRPTSLARLETLLQGCCSYQSGTLYLYSPSCVNLSSGISYLPASPAVSALEALLLMCSGLIMP